LGGSTASGGTCEICLLELVDVVDGNNIAVILIGRTFVGLTVAAAI
jgi:hypothetical protein